jgi:putative Holliday junction resolvase
MLPNMPRFGFAKARAPLYTVPMRRLGIDLGTVRTGLAIAEPEVPVATPLCTLQHKSLQQAVSLVAEVIVREHIAEVVVGLPLRMDGSEGDAVRRVRGFAQALSTQAKVGVRLWDERLTTVAALRSLRGQSMRRGEKQRVVDQVAATLVLQSYLDSQRPRGDEGDAGEFE